MSSAIFLNLDQSKILSSGYGLMNIRKNPVENIVGEGKNILVIGIFPFPPMFSTVSEIIITATFSNLFEFCLV